VSESPDLPPLWTAELDEAGLDALLTDVELGAELLEVRLKRGAAERGEASSLGLADVRSAFAAGSVLGVQLRYRHDGTVWCDTLVRTPSSVRLVRARA